MGTQPSIEDFIAKWRETGGSEIANTQSFINELCALLDVPVPEGSKSNVHLNDYVYERSVFQDNGDGTQSFGRIDLYKRACFILEAKQGSEADRIAAGKGEDDLDLFGQTATVRVKRGTAMRGTPGWAKAMLQAKGQAERYAKALPVDHGWPPILMVADIGYCIEVYADFTGTGKAYAQFPDRARYRIMMDDLRDPDVQDRLRAIWTDPKTLDPTARAARVTREVADLLATVARRIEKRGYNAETTSGFLMRVLFTMFAEDSGLIPHGSFTGLLKAQRANPEHLEHQLSALWAAMDKGEFSPALGVPLKKFNGYLFKERTAIPLDVEELDVLIRASEHVWTEVEPAIFGTLLERALNPKERSKLGAHFTPRAYVDRLIGPTIMEPLRAEWDGVRVATADLIVDPESEEGKRMSPSQREAKAKEARALVEAFHAKLAQTKVLDPACGTGNFLYVALARMKELEGEVIDLLIELGDDQYVAEMSGHTITPENFLGIEINPRAAAIAQLVLWIGYLQWHFRVNGKDRAPPEPILRDVRTIENRDALIDWDDKVLEVDVDGRPVSRWDGETMKAHPVTGKLVPDEAAQVEVYRYIKPRAAKWPKADYIIGNPPFIGAQRLRDRLGDGYFKALFTTTDVPESADFVMHWWDKAANAVRKDGTRRLGFVTTNSITQVFNRRVTAKHLDAKERVSIAFCIPDHPWIDEKDGAAVRIAMTTAIKGRVDGRLLNVTDEKDAPEHIDFIGLSGLISSDLRVGADLTSAVELKANSHLSAMGVKLHGEGFLLSQGEAETFRALDRTGVENHIKQFVNGSDVNQRSRNMFAIDVDGLSEAELKAKFPEIYQHLLVNVKPVRDQNNEPSRRLMWWKFGRRDTELRSFLSGLPRYIGTAYTAKQRIFQFLDDNVLPESMVITIGSGDAFVLGVLSSRIHFIWTWTTSSTLGVASREQGHRYNKTICFEQFPFPADIPEQLKARIRTEAEELDALRKQILASHGDLTLTGLYNVLGALKAGRTLTDKERDIHDRGLVTLIRQHHDAIDALVAEAYGWPLDLADEEILTRLVALNKERAAEEAKGIVRWLRPEFQAPDYAAPVAQMLDLGEGAVPLPDNVIPWPEKLPDQISAVAQVLAAARTPLAAQDVARSFRGKRPATVRPMLDALAGVGLARRLNDGRYAA